MGFRFYIAHPVRTASYDFLVGIDKDEVTSYQWQVDRGDGKGWVDVDGANGDKYIYIANAETITYKWRLIVNIKD